MIDLTPLDVRKKRGDFRKILRGYDPEEVDTFMDLVAERFEELVRENLALTDKTGRLEEQLEGLVGRESAVQEALVSAQKLREDVKGQSERDASVILDRATREAELLKAEADAEIGRRLGEAEGLIMERQRALEELERSRMKFLKSFRGLLEREFDAVEVEEARRPLEETPLELEFRGWAPAGGLDPEAGLEADPDADVKDVDADVEEIEADAEEVEAVAEEMDSVAEEAEAVEVEPESVPEEIEALADEAEAAADLVEEVVAPVEELAPEDVGEDLPDGFDTQVLEGAVPVGIEDLAPARALGSVDPPQEEDTGEGGEVAAAETEEDPSSIPEEPKWLFSLLKKEQEGKGSEG